MNIHEYQAKQLLARYGVAVLKGGVAYTAEMPARQILGGDANGEVANPHRRPAGRFRTTTTAVAACASSVVDEVRKNAAGCWAAFSSPSRPDRRARK